ncbi:Acbp from Moniliophthora Perniciosa [Rhizoctonia solani]|nr:Acbp from Moniliophthora Perniciosa [Rhizoctonia solani]
MTQAKFDKAVAIVQDLPKEGPVQPSQDDKLAVSTIGDVNTTRPGMLDFVGKAKWDAWKGVEGTSKEEAQSKYVEKLLEVLEKFDNEEAKKWITEIQNA